MESPADREPREPPRSTHRRLDRDALGARPGRRRGARGASRPPAAAGARATCGCTSRAWAPTTSTTRCPVIVRGEGCYVYDEHGKRYLDGALGAVLRERRPRPRRARARRPPRRWRELGFYTNWSYAHPPSIELAARIASLAPGNLNRVFFTSGGSEAVESAWKLAKAYHRARGEHAPPQADLAQARLPRHLDGRAHGDRPDAAARAVRAAHAGRRPRAQHQLLPLAARTAIRCGRPTRSRRRSSSRAPRRSRR